MSRIIQRRILLLLVVCFGLLPLLHGQVSWDIPNRRQSVQVDGFLREWDAIPSLSVNPGAPGVSQNGQFAPSGDAGLEIKGFWNEQALYLAVRWTDNVWDTQRVARQEAVWTSPDGRQRRDKMLFFDNLKLELREDEHDYVLWMAPRISGRGPFSWYRLMKSTRGLEVASATPGLAFREEGATVTIEVVLQWRELKMKGKRGETYPLQILLADSDLAGKPLELKARDLRSLLWSGQLRLAP